MARLCIYLIVTWHIFHQFCHYNFFFIFCSPKNKYIRITKDEHFRVDEHYLSNVGIQAEKCCAYDLEDVDVVWLNIVNGERVLMGMYRKQKWLPFLRTRS